jgi:hypothetical protein
VVRGLRVVDGAVSDGDGVPGSFGGGHGGSRFQEVMMVMTVAGLRCLHPGQVAWMFAQRWTGG